MGKDSDYDFIYAGLRFERIDLNLFIWFILLEDDLMLWGVCGFLSLVEKGATDITNSSQFDNFLVRFHEDERE